PRLQELIHLEIHDPRFNKNWGTGSKPAPRKKYEFQAGVAHRDLHISKKNATFAALFSIPCDGKLRSKSLNFE
ncbi:MAG: hypothetical protein K2L27_02275, partial [Muribaculaceae bacterium]|nr:hypothetical protein [Muribaculaceae bacterium]